MLTSMSKRERSLSAQFKFGILASEIEVGRYHNKPIAERKCPFYAVVEDEKHFIFYLTVKCTMNLGEIFWVLVLTTRIVMLMELCKLQEMFKTSPRKLARYIEKAYDLRSSCIKKLVGVV